MTTEATSDNGVIRAIDIAIISSLKPKTLAKTKFIVAGGISDSINAAASHIPDKPTAIDSDKCISGEINSRQAKIHSINLLSAALSILKILYPTIAKLLSMMVLSTSLTTVRGNGASTLPKNALSNRDIMSAVAGGNLRTPFNSSDKLTPLPSALSRLPTTGTAIDATVRYAALYIAAGSGSPYSMVTKGIGRKPVFCSAEEYIREPAVLFPYLSNLEYIMKHKIVDVAVYVAATKIIADTLVRSVNNVPYSIRYGIAINSKNLLR